MNSPVPLTKDISFDFVPYDTSIRVFYLETPPSSFQKFASLKTSDHDFSVNANHTGIGFVSGDIRFYMDFSAKGGMPYAILPTISESGDIVWKNEAVVSLGAFDGRHWLTSDYMCDISRDQFMKIKDLILDEFIPDNPIYALFAITPDDSVQSMMNPIRRGSISDDFCFYVITTLQKRFEAKLEYITTPTYTFAGLVPGPHGVSKSATGATGAPGSTGSTGSPGPKQPRAPIALNTKDRQDDVISWTGPSGSEVFQLDISNPSDKKLIVDFYTRAQKTVSDAMKVLKKHGSNNSDITVHPSQDIQLAFTLLAIVFSDWMKADPSVRGMAVYYTYDLNNKPQYYGFSPKQLFLAHRQYPLSRDFEIRPLSQIMSEKARNPHCKCMLWTGVAVLFCFLCVGLILFYTSGNGKKKEGSTQQFQYSF